MANPTTKQRKFAEAIIKNPERSIAEAGRIAGWKDRQSAYRSLQNPTIQDQLRGFLNALEIEGVTDRKSANVLSEAMNAVRVVNGKKIPDHKIRLQANETYIKLRRLIIPPARTDIEDASSKSSVVIVLGGDII